MLRTAGVEINGHPIRLLFRIGELLIVRWICVAQKVPRRIDKCIKRVRLTFRSPFAIWTFHSHPLLSFCERRFSTTVRQIVLYLRKFDGQILVRHSDYSARWAVNNGYRDTPVALTRDE